MYKVKFVSVNDILLNSNLKLAEDVFNKFDANKIDYNINDVIEFYNITKYIDAEMFLKAWSEDYIKNIREIVKEYKRIIGLFFQDICDDNFIKLYEEVEKEYKKDFWEITEKYKVYKKVSNKEFEKLMKNKKQTLSQIIKNKNWTEYYGEIIRDCLLSDANNAELILDKYEVKHFAPKDNIYLPTSFSNADKETLILNYVKSSNPNLNYLRIIVNIQSRKESIEITDRTRLEAKNRMRVEEERIFDKRKGIQMSTIVKFCESQEKAYELKHNGQNVEYSYSVKWIQDNLDFNTLLNNFIYLFGYVDGQMRITLVNKTNDLSVFERLSLNSKKSYIIGTEFTLKDILSTLQIVGYYQQLVSLDVRLEDVIEWFFREYLVNEFSINDYRIIMPSNNSSYLEKCRTVLPEIESVLKQYELIVEDGKINHELLQMSSGHLLLKDCKSQVNKKYIYANQDELNKVTYYFFSDQCMLSYVERIEDKYNNFYDLLLNEKITMDDYLENEIVEIKWLLDNGYIKINDTGHIELANPIQAYIFKDLYYNEVINYWMCPEIYRLEIDRLLDIGFVSFENTLFSKPEQDYFNYHLNKSTFNNSLDLRNMYSHGTQPNDANGEKMHIKNYMIFLKLLILIIIKINDEFCIVNGENYSGVIKND